MRNPVVIDGRRIYNPSDFEDKVKFAAIGFGHDATAQDETAVSLKTSWIEEGELEGGSSHQI